MKFDGRASSRFDQNSKTEKSLRKKACAALSRRRQAPNEHTDSSKSASQLKLPGESRGQLQFSEIQARILTGQFYHHCNRNCIAVSNLLPIHF